MLSVLIPIYNHNIKNLIEELHRQLIQSGIMFELLCVDDGSRIDYRIVNREVKYYKHLIYKELDQNIGRARIRNRLASQAKFTKLLYLDSDSEIHNTAFINNYLKHVHTATVINGGRKYTSEEPTEVDKILHYIYGTIRESKPASFRNTKPELYFHTNNFVIDKQVVKSYPFDESLTGYGYEDLAMAAELVNNNIKIKHIENPVIHMDLELTGDFLAKIEESLMSLSHLYLHKKIARTPLLKLYQLLVQSHMKDKFISFYQKNESRIIKNLYSTKPSMRKLDMYKLYHFCIAIDSLHEA